MLEKDIEKVLPVINEDGSDSAMLDNYLQFLTLSGYSLPGAVMLTIPEPWENNPLMDAKKHAFYEYNSCMTEPWDGPAHIIFTDGTQVGALLDRNGFRPGRWQLTITAGTGYSILPAFQNCFAIFYCSWRADINMGISCFFLDTTPFSR